MLDFTDNQPGVLGITEEEVWWSCIKWQHHPGLNHWENQVVG